MDKVDELDSSAVQGRPASMSEPYLVQINEPMAELLRSGKFVLLGTLSYSPDEQKLRLAISDALPKEEVGAILKQFDVVIT